MCREGQLREPKAVIIADKNFPGDSEAFKIKEWRGKEESWLRLPFKEIDADIIQDAWERVTCLEGHEHVFSQWKRTLKEKERVRRAAKKKEEAEKRRSQQSQATAGTSFLLERGRA